MDLAILISGARVKAVGVYAVAGFITSTAACSSSNEVPMGDHRDGSLTAEANPSVAGHARFESASVAVSRGSTCTIHPQGNTDPRETLPVPVDEDGIAGFHAVRPTQESDVQRVTLDCTGIDGASNSYTVDLRSDEAFAPRAFDPARSSVEVRPALSGDPLSYASADLLRWGYGVRPDPVANPDGYARWLAAATMPMRKHRRVLESGTTRVPPPSPAEAGTMPMASPAVDMRVAAPLMADAGRSPPVADAGGRFFGSPGPPAAHDIAAELRPHHPPDAGTTLGSTACGGDTCYWTGVILSGLYNKTAGQGYGLNQGTFYVPTFKPGGFDTGDTQMSIWTGLDDVFQALVWADVTASIATTGVQVQAHLPLASGNGTRNGTFALSAGDEVYAEEWYCDVNGNVTLTGGYACAYIVDLVSGDGLDCNTPSATCPSYQLAVGDTIGTQSECIVENDSQQYGDTWNWPDFANSPVVMSCTTEVYHGSTFVEYATPSTDPVVTIGLDFPPTSLPYSAEVIVAIPTTNGTEYETAWAVAWPQLAIYVRPTGEAEVVAQGPNNSLLGYYNSRGGAWNTSTIAAAGTAFSAPAVSASPTGETDVVVQGTSNSLQYYNALPNKNWSAPYTIAGNNTTYSAPSIFVRSTGEIDVVAQGANNSLQYYHANPGPTGWSSSTVAGAGTTFSAPSIFVRSTGEADIVARGASNSLQYYHALPGVAWSTAYAIAGTNTTYSAPSIYVRPTGEADVVAQGFLNSLQYYTATPGSGWTASQIAQPNTTFSAASISVSAAGEADVVAQGYFNTLQYYYLPPGSGYWNNTQVASTQTTYATPSIFVRPSGEVDVVTPPSVWNGSSFNYYVAAAAPIGAPPFAQPAEWSTVTFDEAVATVLGDVNGDGMADAVGFNGSNTWVELSQGSSFGAAAEWSTVAFQGSVANLVGDVNGDGMADAVGLDGSSTWVMLSGGNSFGPPVSWSSVEFDGTVANLLADVNGDFKQDLVGFRGSSTWVMLATTPPGAVCGTCNSSCVDTCSNACTGGLCPRNLATSFGPPAEWSSVAFQGTVANLVGDVNGDGLADAVGFNGSSTWVMLSQGNTFGAPTEWSSVAFQGTVATLLADVNGDGRADAVALDGSSTWVMLSAGTAFGAPAEWASVEFDGTQANLLADVNGDGLADVVGFNLATFSGGYHAGNCWTMLAVP
jgi:hypothetical protein